MSRVARRAERENQPGAGEIKPFQEHSVRWKMLYLKYKGRLPARWLQSVIGLIPPVSAIYSVIIAGGRQKARAKERIILRE